MTTGFTEYDKYDGLGLAELVCSKQVRSIELVEEAISRIESLNPRVNAVINKMYEQARTAAAGDLPDGPFKGVPFMLKDLAAFYAGVPLTCGSRFFKDFVPDHDSELVRRFKAAGVITVGKTNTPEFGLAFVTEPELFGPANNPWDLTRTTGGSSGGSAAAVAARIVPLAHGNDGGGSMRVPSSCCGVFGLKPTRGRNPAGPDFGDLWRGFACEHVITRSVRDSAAMLDATAGPDTGAPYYAAPPARSFLSEVGADPGKLRIAFTSEPFLGSTVEEDCVKGLEEAVKLCQDLGHEVVEAVPQIDGKAVARAFMTVVCSETGALIDEASELFNRKASYKDFEPVTWIITLLGDKFSGPDLSHAINSLQLCSRQVGGFFEKYDVLLTPTLAMPPLKTGEFQVKGIQTVMMKLLGRFNAGSLIKTLVGIDVLAEEAYKFTPYTPLFNVTGQPAMSVPLHWNDEGLPIGMQFVGRYGDEATLFRLAGQLEKARPWAGRVPPVCANVTG
ncbi:MAG TPA: amidase [Dehalococcoidales bacterium]|nr:amidase [Dehalococcoidales bacterium]